MMVMSKYRKDRIPYDFSASTVYMSTVKDAKSSANPPRLDRGASYEPDYRVPGRLVDGELVFAIQGLVRRADGKGPPAYTCYLIIGAFDLESQNFKTNKGITAKLVMDSLPSDVSEVGFLRKRLPAGYEKLGDTPEKLAHNRYPTHIVMYDYPHRGLLLFMPFAIAADVATLPIQIIILPVTAMLYGDPFC